MLSNIECRALAEQYLHRLAQQCGEELVLIPDPLETLATLAYGYNTASFVATGDYIYALAGNGPLMVSKLTGEIKEAGTALPIEHYVREFEAISERSAQGRQLPSAEQPRSAKSRRRLREVFDKQVRKYGRLVVPGSSR